MNVVDPTFKYLGFHHPSYFSVHCIIMDLPVAFVIFFLTDFSFLFLFSHRLINRMQTDFFGVFYVPKKYFKANISSILYILLSSQFLF